MIINKQVDVHIHWWTCRGFDPCFCKHGTIFQIRNLNSNVLDRLSFRYFLGFPENIPDFTTIWKIRDRLQHWRNRHIDLVWTATTTWQERIQSWKRNHSGCCIHWSRSWGRNDTVKRKKHGKMEKLYITLRSKNNIWIRMAVSVWNMVRFTMGINPISNWM